MNTADHFRYQKLKNELETQIQHGNYPRGAKFASEPELCRQFKLSRSTVRQAIRELELQGFLFRIRGKGTFIRSIHPNRSNKIALIIYDTAYLTNPVTANLLRGIDQVLQNAGFALDVLASRRDFIEEAMFRLPEIYAGFLIGAYRLDERILQELKNSGRPFLFVKNYLEAYKNQALLIDFERAGFLAAQELIQQGCHNLGLIYPGDGIAIARDFGRGVRLGCLEYGAALKQENILNCDFNTPDAAAFSHLGSPAPDGIICATDEQAIALCAELQQLNIAVPQQVKVTGCNHTVPVPRDLPALTTIEIPTYELGRQAASCLLNLIKGEKMILPPAIAPDLIVGESTRVTS